MLLWTGIVYFIFPILIVLPEFVSADWVEIPFLQPSTTTEGTTIIRKNINQPSYIANSNIISHVLPVASVRPILTEVEVESSVDVASSDKQHQLYLRPLQNPVTPVKISNLVDFDEFTRSYTTKKAVTTGKYANFQKRFYDLSRANISTVPPWSLLPKDKHLFVTTANRTEPPIDLEDHLPLSNKYEEESIEYLNQAVIIPYTKPHIVATQDLHVNHRLDFPVDVHANDEPEYSSFTGETASGSLKEKPQTNGEQFTDFDNFSEVHSEQFQQQPVHNSTIVKKRRRPLTRERVTIVRVVPPKRRHRPKDTNADGTFGGFLKFLKRMQEGFMLKTAKSLGDKIKLLKNLKDQLLWSIENRMSTLWGRPPISEGNDNSEIIVNGKGHQRRVKRGWMDTHSSNDHGGIDFPSTEATLLTLSFLTFAVFLIKLVLQVINTIKSKHYTYSTLTTLNGATLKLKRSKRSPMEEELSNHNLNIMSAINDYKFK